MRFIPSINKIMKTKEKVNSVVYFILGLSFVFFLFATVQFAHAGTIYANEKSVIFNGDGIFHFDVFSGAPVTILNVSGISFDTAQGVIVYCDGNFLAFSKGLPVNLDMVINCASVDIYDAGIDSSTTGNIVITYLEGIHTASEIVSGTDIPTQSMPQNLYYGFTLFFAVFFFMVWVLRKR